MLLMKRDLGCRLGTTDLQHITEDVVCVCCDQVSVVLLFSQADVANVSPGMQYTVTVTAASSSNISPGVSRMINTNDSGETCARCLLLFVCCRFSSALCCLIQFLYDTCTRTLGERN